jgi:hypothetical protein
MLEKQRKVCQCNSDEVHNFRCSNPSKTSSLKRFYSFFYCRSGVERPVAAVASVALQVRRSPLRRGSWGIDRRPWLSSKMPLPPMPFKALPIIKGVFCIFFTHSRQPLTCFLLFHPCRMVFFTWRNQQVDDSEAEIIDSDSDPDSESSFDPSSEAADLFHFTCLLIFFETVYQIQVQKMVQKELWWLALDRTYLRWKRRNRPAQNACILVLDFLPLLHIGTAWAVTCHIFAVDVGYRGRRPKRWARTCCWLMFRGSNPWPGTGFGHHTEVHRGVQIERFVQDDMLVLDVGKNIYNIIYIYIIYTLVCRPLHCIATLQPDQDRLRQTDHQILSFRPWVVTAISPFPSPRNDAMSLDWAKGHFKPVQIWMESRAMPKFWDVQQLRWQQDGNISRVPAISKVRRFAARDYKSAQPQLYVLQHVPFCCLPCGLLSTKQVMGSTMHCESWWWFRAERLVHRRKCMLALL